jgi:6-phosphogluconate dehydrogenase
LTDLDGSGLTFIGMGVSGGEEGARHGPSIMVGGAEEAWNRVEPVLTAISAKYQGEPCAAWLGENGAGHFVKTIHNGIEYADMQMIAEVYGVMRDHLHGCRDDCGGVFGVVDRAARFLSDRHHRRSADGPMMRPRGVRSSM